MPMFTNRARSFNSLIRKHLRRFYFTRLTCCQSCHPVLAAPQNGRPFCRVKYYVLSKATGARHVCIFLKVCVAGKLCLGSPVGLDRQRMHAGAARFLRPGGCTQTRPAGDTILQGEALGSKSTGRVQRPSGDSRWQPGASCGRSEGPVMQLRTRLLGAIVLMAAGLTAAMFFRRAPSEPPPIPQVERPPVLRQRSTPPAPQATVAQRPNRAASATKRPADSAQQCPATVVEPVDRMPPPQLPATYPDFVRQEAGGDDLGARSPLGLGMMPSAPIGRTQRRIVHTIVDGPGQRTPAEQPRVVAHRGATCDSSR